MEPIICAANNQRCHLHSSQCSDVNLLTPLRPAGLFEDVDRQRACREAAVEQEGVRFKVMPIIACLRESRDACLKNCLLAMAVDGQKHRRFRLKGTERYNCNC